MKSKNVQWVKRWPSALAAVAVSISCNSSALSATTQRETSSFWRSPMQITTNG